MSAENQQANDIPVDAEKTEAPAPRVYDYEKIVPVIAFVNAFQDANPDDNKPPFFFIAQNSDSSMQVICCGDLDNYANLISNAALENDVFFAAIREAVQNVTRIKFTDQMKKRLMDIGALDAEGKPTADAGEKLMADIKKMAAESGVKLEGEGNVEEKPADASAEDENRSA